MVPVVVNATVTTTTTRITMAVERISTTKRVAIRIAIIQATITTTVEKLKMETFTSANTRTTKRHITTMEEVILTTVVEVTIEIRILKVTTNSITTIMAEAMHPRVVTIEVVRIVTITTVMASMECIHKARIKVAAKQEGITNTTTETIITTTMDKAQTAPIKIAGTTQAM